MSLHTLKNPPRSLEEELDAHAKKVLAAQASIAAGAAITPIAKSPYQTYNGLISDFGYHQSIVTGYQASEWEQRQEQIRKDRIHAFGAKRRALEVGTQADLVSRSSIIERDASTCHLCGEHCEPEDIHLDHVIPLSRGGTHTEDNLKVAHAYCNMSKGSKLLTEYAA